MLLGDLALDIDLGKLDSLFLIKLELEFFVLLTGFFEELHRCSFLLDRLRVCFALRSENFSLTHSGGGRFLNNSLGNHLLSRGFLLRGGLLSFGPDDTLFSTHLSRGLACFSCFDDGVSILICFQLSRFLTCFGFLDLRDERLLGIGLSRCNRDLLKSICGGKFFGILNALFFFDDAFFDSDSLTNHLLDFLLLNLDRLLGFDALQLGDTLALDLLKHALTLHALQLDTIGAFLVSQGDDHLPLLIFFSDENFFLSSNTSLLRFLTLLFLDLSGLGFLTILDCFDFPLLFGLGLGKLTLKFKNRLTGFDVLLLNDLFLISLNVIRKLGLSCCELSDLFNTLGIENIIGVEHAQWSLLKIINRCVIKNESIQIGSNDFQDLVTKGVAIFVEGDEVEALTNGLESFGELSIEECANLVFR